MMKQHIFDYSPRGSGSILLSLTFILLTAIGCTTEDAMNNQTTSEEDGNEVIIEIGEDATRGAYVEGKDLLKYGVYSFYSDTKKMYLNNSILTRAKAGDAWKKSKAIKYPNATRALDFYALAPEFSGSLVTESYMKPELKYIVHTLPTTNAKQTDFLFSSLMGATQTKNKVIKFNFKHLFVYLRFNAKLNNEKIDVVVHSIKLHNLKSTGKFTMDNDKANTGSWTLDDVYADYEFVLPKDSSLVNKKTLTLHKTDSLLFVMPQNPTLFKFVEGSNSFSDADDAKEAYASLMVKIKNKETGDYIGPCSDTTYAEVYYPIKSASWITAKQPFGASKTVSIEFTGGFTKEGNDYLKEYSDDADMENTSVEGVQGGVYSTEDWVDDTDNSVTITL